MGIILLRAETQQPLESHFSAPEGQPGIYSYNLCPGHSPTPSRWRYLSGSLIQSYPSPFAENTCIVQTAFGNSVTIKAKPYSCCNAHLEECNSIPTTLSKSTSLKTESKIQIKHRKQKRGIICNLPF